jgi:hypothetical protein
MPWTYALLFMFLGWLLVWATKYIFFGLRQWDEWLHPERLCGDLSGPYRRFSEPFLGVF